MQQLAILGGTFDPVHWGHLLLAETALSQFALDAIIWVPTRFPSHKTQTPPIGFEERLQMVHLAIAERSEFILPPVAALKQTLPNYAIHTLLDLQSLYPKGRWYWIVGLDTFQSLPRWYRRQDLVPACEWLVAPRPGSTLNLEQTRSICHTVVRALAREAIAIRFSLLQMPSIEISSTLVRHYLRQQKSIRYLVPENVRLYLQQKQLYTAND